MKKRFLFTASTFALISFLLSACGSHNSTPPSSKNALDRLRAPAQSQSSSSNTAEEPVSAESTTSMLFIRGDLNFDSTVDFGDITPFILAFDDPDAHLAQYGYSASITGDINCDGEFDFSDIVSFIIEISGDGEATNACFKEKQKLVSPSSPMGFPNSNNFGNAVSISENSMIVGAYWDDPKGFNSGSAYVFRFNGTGWVLEQRLVAPDGSEEDYFGTSVSISGNRAIVGAYQDDAKGFNSGSAYVFRFNGTGWVLEQELIAYDGAGNNYFGYSVSISDDRAIMGAYGDNDKGTFSGSAYIYRFNGTDWVLEKKVHAPDGAALDRFGLTASLSEERAIVGAYIYHFDGTNWKFEKKLVPPDSAAYYPLIRSVSLSGDRAVMAPADDETGTNSGPVYIYRFNGIDWTLEKKLLAPNGSPSDLFGWSVSLSGDRAVVGAPKDDDNGTNSGSAYVFRFNGTDWVLEKKLVVPDNAAFDYFGWSVSLSGDRAVVGAPNDDDNGTNSGSAYIFESGW